MDEDTLQFYRRNAEAYAGWAKAPSTRLVGFLAHAAGSRLDPRTRLRRRQSFEGDARARLFSARHRWLAGNGRIASQRLNHRVDTHAVSRTRPGVEAYDGVWANACLLHVPRDQLAHVLSLIRRALKPGGVFFASYKEGEVGGRDALDRYYNYPSQDWLRACRGRQLGRVVDRKWGRQGI